MQKVFRKKIFYLILLIITIGIVLYLTIPFVYRGYFNIIEENNPLNGFEKSNPLLVSSIYRYDQKQKEYVSDKGNDWYKSNFSLYVYDIGRNIEPDECYYFIYDNIKKIEINHSYRECNSEIIIEVGENKDCQSQGEKACSVYVYAVDITGRRGEIANVVYNIDWEQPKIGNVFIEENQEYPIKVERQESTIFQVKISDNIGIGQCNFYLDGNLVDSMNIHPFPCKENKECIASIDYSFEKGENHYGSVKCIDSYNVVEEKYLNVVERTFDVVISINHVPEIIFCKVSPTNGSISKKFEFEVEASDFENEELFYNWDFDDGNNSNEENPIYYYSESGIYQPKVIVSDKQGQEVECPVAWIVVND